MKQKIINYTFRTGMGQGSITDLPFLTEDEMSELNLIGYSGKNSKGQISTREIFLNGLGKGTFVVNQTKYDNGSFEEAFNITRVFTENVKVSTNDVSNLLKGKRIESFGFNGGQIVIKTNDDIVVSVSGGNIDTTTLNVIQDGVELANMDFQF